MDVKPEVDVAIGPFIGCLGDKCLLKISLRVCEEELENMLACFNVAADGKRVDIAVQVLVREQVVILPVDRDQL